MIILSIYLEDSIEDSLIQNESIINEMPAMIIIIINHSQLIIWIARATQSLNLFMQNVV